MLLRQVGAAGYQALLYVDISDDLEQLVELRHAQALADVGLEQALALAGRERVRTLQVDGLDREAAGVDRCLLRHWRYGLAGQFLELFEAAALFFEEAILTIADQVCIARGRSRMSAEREAANDDGQRSNDARPEK